MKLNLTPKLYFNKFTNCITFDVATTADLIRGNPTIGEIKGIISGSGIETRTRLDWHFTNKKRSVIATLRVYHTDPKLWDLLSASPHHDLIVSVTAPASDLHRQLLLDGVEIELRERLIYSRFRYKVQLLAGPMRQEWPMIDDWLKNQFQDRKHGQRGDYLVVGNWCPVLYLLDDIDLTMVKLSLSEHISSVIRVDTFAEHGLDPSVDHQQP